MPQRTDQHPLDGAAFGPRAVAVAEIDRESSLPAEGDDGGVVDLKKRSSAAATIRGPLACGQRCYMRWKYSAVSSSTAGFDVCNCTSGGTSSSASE
jgi:hypothetical protein